MPSTQGFLQFDHVRNDVIVLKNGDLRAVLRVLPINFGLKSQEEQDAITYGFQNFLNSLDFDLQIVMQSHKMNIDPYLKDLEQRAERQESELLRTQTEEYAEFIRSFVQTTNIMTKQFYIIIPFSLLKAKQQASGLLKTIPSLFSPKKISVMQMDESHFAAARTQLLQRVEFVARGLEQLGLRSTMLATEEIIQLLWKLYNPGQHASGFAPEIPADAIA